MDSGSSSRAADAAASPAKKAAPTPAPAASPAKKAAPAASHSNKTVPAPAPAPAASPAKKAVPAPAAWGRAPAAAGALAGVHVMGFAEYWPALSGGMVMPAAAAAPKSKAPHAAAAPCPPKPTRVAASIGNPGASRTVPGYRAAPARPAPSPERRGAVPEQSPAHAPNHRSNGGGALHQHGRFPPHPHGRSGYNGGSRRAVGGGISVGNATVNGNGGGVRHGQEHRWGFDGQPGGRGHQDGHGPGHRQPGPQMTFAWAPHPFPAQLPPPPPVPFFAPPMPPFHGAYYGPMIGYAHPEFAHGFYVPPPPDALHFAPYPALPVHVMLPHIEQHVMLPHMEQQAVQPHVEEPEAAKNMEEQQAVQPHVEEPEAAKHVEEPEEEQLSAEELEEKLRKQIEYYFSENNLCKDPFLKQNMDAEGWVPLRIVAVFPKVEKKTTDLELILKSVSSSSEVEVQDGKIRRRIGWEKYILRRNSFPDN